MIKTPKTIVSWSGTGRLYREDDLIAEVEYGLRVCKDQESISVQEGDASLAFFSAGSFTAVGYEPDIEPGSEMMLDLEDGNRVSIVIANYDFGKGSFQLTKRTLEELFTGS